MEAGLGFLGRVLMEKRSGLAGAAELTRASGHAERLAALATVDRVTTRRRPLGADRGYDAKDCVAELRERWLTPHVAENTSGRCSAIDGRTRRHPGYARRQHPRERIDAAVGWIKTTAGQTRTRDRGLERVG